MDPPAPLCAVAPSVVCASGCLALLVAFRPPSRSAASDIVRTPSIPLTSRALVRSAAPSDACNSDVAPRGPSVGGGASMHFHAALQDTR